ncbi:uncharacterized protein LOC130185583 isoform X2 [Seriola aureovittata]|uniref:uncharacterized protein LOC130185583 isoform X2 n=1 Tax=Seriola aureovittata TaxID=2871759 RepID=UPI0024BD96E0|nr:uncharacterized protein LOC130185583 isoform X2 [Seriola aureovittata]
MMLSKPPRTKYMMQDALNSSYDVPQPAYEDPDAAKPAVTDGSQRSEVKVKPVPRPRSKSKPENQSNTNVAADSGDDTNNNSNAVSFPPSERPAERPHPVRPPPRPPKCLTFSKPAAAVDGGSQRMDSNAESTVKPPAENTQNPPPPRPQRPPPSVYCDKLQSAMQSTSCTESPHPATSSTQQPAVSVSVPEGEPSLCGTHNETATHGPDRPAVPPRLSQSSLPRPAPVCDASPRQTRPPPPPFNPPPPPSTGTPSDSVYWEIEHRPYLDILSKDEDKMTQGKTMPRSGLRFQSSCFSSCREDTDDYYGMLRWLTRVSRPDYMTPSLYGLSIEEETRLFNQRAVDVSKALRLFNVLMMKRNETLRNVITEFSSISSSLDKLQKKTKNMGIAGGTTGAVGGVTAVVGIALAPMTMGASLIATVVGAGMVASAGGMGAHTAKANKKIVNRMRVEKLVYDYKTNVADLEHCLNFILSVMNELRRHDIARLQQAGAQTHALKMAHLSQSVFRNDTDKGKRRSSAPHAGGLSSERLLLAFVKELDQYFTEKDGQKLKKTNKSRFSGRVRLLAENLQEELEHLNHMWEKFS